MNFRIDRYDSRDKNMPAVIISVLLSFVTVSSGLLDGIPTNQELHHDASLQFLMSEVMRLSNGLKEAQGQIKGLQHQVGE